jgi:hypothetical protein
VALPTFRDILIGEDLRLVDFARVHAGSEVLRRGVRNIRRLIADSRNQDLCEREAVAKRARATLPRGADFNEWYQNFDAETDPELGDWICDERLGLIRFAVYEQTNPRRAIGTFIIYNYAEVDRGPEFIRGVGYPMPCHPLDENWKRRTGGILRAFLKRDLRLVGTEQRFKLVEWDFPTKIPGLRWSGGRGDGAIDGVLDALVTVDGAERENKDGHLRRLKRPAEPVRLAKKLT